MKKKMSKAQPGFVDLPPFDLAAAVAAARARVTALEALILRGGSVVQNTAYGRQRARAVGVARAELAAMGRPLTFALLAGEVEQVVYEIASELQWAEIDRDNTLCVDAPRIDPSFRDWLASVANAPRDVVEAAANEAAQYRVDYTIEPEREPGEPPVSKGERMEDFLRAVHALLVAMNLPEPQSFATWRRSREETGQRPKKRHTR